MNKTYKDLSKETIEMLEQNHYNVTYCSINNTEHYAHCVLTYYDDPTVQIDIMLKGVGDSAIMASSDGRPFVFTTEEMEAVIRVVKELSGDM
jgi:hypothetical protein